MWHFLLQATQPPLESQKKPILFSSLCRWKTFSHLLERLSFLITFYLPLRAEFKCVSICYTGCGGGLFVIRGFLILK